VLSSLERAAFDSILVTKTLYLVYLAIGEYVSIYMATFGFIYTGAHVTQKLREQYVAAIMRQNIAFFDTLGTGEVINRITADLNLIQDGISEKVGFTMTGLATFVAAFAIGFGMYWSVSHHYPVQFKFGYGLTELRINSYTLRNFVFCPP
jgi:ATP-binding cassette subfamily B (MDR/TAP) protein 1